MNKRHHHRGQQSEAPFLMENDVADLTAWRDGPDVGSLELEDLGRRLSQRTIELPVELHYTALELVGELAAMGRPLPDGDLFRVLTEFAGSANRAAAAVASVLLFRDFALDHACVGFIGVLDDPETPGFYDVLLALSHAPPERRTAAADALRHALTCSTASPEAIAEISKVLDALANSGIDPVRRVIGAYETCRKSIEWRLPSGRNLDGEHLSDDFTNAIHLVVRMRDHSK